METRSKFATTIEPGLFALAREEFKRAPETWRNYLTVKGSDRAYEESAYISGYGYCFEKPEGTAVPLDDRIQGPTKRWVMKTYALGTRITWEAQDDDLYSVMRQAMKDMSVSAVATRHVLAVRPIMTGTVTTYHTGGDGLALFVTNHTRLDGGTWSNTTTAASPTEATVTAAVQNFEAIRDNRGKNYDQKAQAIVCGPSLEFKFAKLLGSNLEPDTANNAINALPNRRKLKLYVDKEITDARWVVMGEKDPDTGFIFFDRTKPRMKRTEDPDTGDYKYSMMMRFSVEANEPRQMYLIPAS